MIFDLSAFQFAGVLGAYLFASFAKGVTGLGFTTTSLPILVLLLGLKDALPLVILPSVCSNLIVMRQAGRFSETVRRFWPMLLALLPGLLLGLWALASIDGVVAGAALGVMLLVWCAFSVFNPEQHLSAEQERALAPLSGFLTGVINGITGSQVVPVVPFLTMLRLDRNLFIQAVNCSFTLSSLVMVLGLGKLGLFSTQDLLISAIGTCLMFFGLRIGSSVRSRLSEDVFRKSILGMLLLMGVTLIAPLLV